MSYNNYISNLRSALKKSLESNISIYNSSNVTKQYLKEKERVAVQLDIFRYLKNEILKLRSLPPTIIRAKLVKNLSNGENKIKQRLKQLNNVHTKLKRNENEKQRILRQKFPSPPRYVPVPVLKREAVSAPPPRSSPIRKPSLTKRLKKLFTKKKK